LTNPAQPPIRQFNFTQIGQANKATNVQTYACVLSVGPIKIGTDVLFNSQLLCNDDGGQWFGPSPTNQFTTCCEVRSNVYPNLVILPSRSWAIRNERFKLVKTERASCDSSENPFEFYDLQPRLSNPVGLDLSINNLLNTNAPPLTLFQA